MAKLGDYSISGEHHPIRIAARYSGLSAEVIRAWERRYHIVEPKRNQSGQRIYSDSDIERLILFAKAVTAGRRIGDIAHLSNQELSPIIEKDHAAAQGVHGSKRKSTALVMEYFDVCVDSVHKFDMHALNFALEKAEDSLGTIFFIEDLMDPLISYIREECRRGAISNAKRYWLMNAIESFLTRLSGRATHSQRRLLAYATESDIDLTALKAVVTANSLGWNAVYLQPVDLQEVVETLQDLPTAGALLVSYGTSAAYDCVPNKFRTLHQLLPHLPIIAQTVGAPLPIVREIGAIHCGSLRQLQLELEQLGVNE